MLNKTTMRKLAIGSSRIAAAILCSVALRPLAQSQTVDVAVRIEVTHRQSHPPPAHNSSSEVVVWLTPQQEISPSPAIEKPQQYTLAQKNKQFVPHLLVVPTGSSVAFPNLDPFYHNVFSLFNGKRFDLGLYEAHSQRSVRFDREGISYIFCNIHPEMGGVVISLSTPYYGISMDTGVVVVRGVPPGSYRLSVWAENVAPDRLNALSRIVEISPKNTNLGTLSLETSGDLMAHHQNKFGESYNPPAKDPY